MAASKLFDRISWEYVFVLLVIVCGIFLRFYNLEYMEFKADERYFLQQTEQNAQQFGSVRSLHSSLSFPHPPLLAYVLLPAVWVTNDPVLVTAYIALLNVLGLGVLFLLVRRTVSQRVALWSVALLASSPWAIIFSRKIWNPDIVFPFLMAFCYAFSQATMRKSTGWTLVAAFLLGLTVQVHLSALLILPPVLLVFFVFRSRFALWSVVAAMGLVGVLLIPYTLDLWPQLPEYKGRSFGAASYLLADIMNSLPRHLYWIAAVESGAGMEYLLGEKGLNFYHETYRLFWASGVFDLFVGLSGISAMWWLVQLRKNAQEPTPAKVVIGLLMLYAATLVITYTIIGAGFHPHYYIFITPLAALLVAYGLCTWSKDVRSSLFRRISSELLVVFCLTNLFYSWAMLDFVSRYPEKIDGDYGQPYAVQQRSSES